jgi:hypothetical protein
MTSAESDLLRTFCERPRRVLSRDSLLDFTHGRNAGSFDRSIDVLVSRIGRKIEPRFPGRHHDRDGAFRRLYVRSHGACGHVPEERLIMKLLGFLNLRGISGQIAALVATSIIAIHLIITATFLIQNR